MFEFEVGSGQVIKGLDWAVKQMSLTSEITLIVPSDWGYGEKGFGDKIPSNAELKYIVKLCSIKDKEPPSIKRNLIIE